MGKLSNQVVDQLIANNTIKAEEKDIYIYGLEQAMLILLNIATTIIIGLFFGMVWQSIVFMMAYLPLRSYAGGYHARTQFRCYIYSVIMIIFVLLAIKCIMKTNFIILALAVGSGVIIFFFAPVEDDNKSLDEAEVRVYRNRTRILLAGELCIMVLLIILGFQMMAQTMAVSLLALAIMLMVGKWNHIENHKRR